MNRRYRGRRRNYLRPSPCLSGGLTTHGQGCGAGAQDFRPAENMPGPASLQPTFRPQLPLESRHHAYSGVINSPHGKETGSFMALCIFEGLQASPVAGGRLSGGAQLLLGRASAQVIRRSLTPLTTELTAEALVQRFVTAR